MKYHRENYLLNNSSLSRYRAHCGNLNILSKSFIATLLNASLIYTDNPLGDGHLFSDCSKLQWAEWWELHHEVAAIFMVTWSQSKCLGHGLQLQHHSELQSLDWHHSRQQLHTHSCSVASAHILLPNPLGHLCIHLHSIGPAHGNSRWHLLVHNSFPWDQPTHLHLSPASGTSVSFCLTTYVALGLWQQSRLLGLLSLSSAVMWCRALWLTSLDLVTENLIPIATGTPGLPVFHNCWVLYCWWLILKGRHYSPLILLCISQSYSICGKLFWTPIIGHRKLSEYWPGSNGLSLAFKKRYHLQKVPRLRKAHGEFCTPYCSGMASHFGLSLWHPSQKNWLWLSWKLLSLNLRKEERIYLW